MSDLREYTKQQLLDELALRECPTSEIVEDMLAVARYIDQHWSDGQSGLKDLCVTQLKEFAGRLRKIKYEVPTKRLPNNQVRFSDILGKPEDLLSFQDFVMQAYPNRYKNIK